MPRDASTFGPEPRTDFRPAPDTFVSIGAAASAAIDHIGALMDSRRTKGVIVSAEHLNNLREQRLAKSPNLQRLEQFVADALRDAPAKPDPAAYLRASAARLRGHLNALCAWAATDDDAPCPAHLAGLTAFDLSDAAERLEKVAG